MSLAKKSRTAPGWDNGSESAADREALRVGLGLGAYVPDRPTSLGTGRRMTRPNSLDKSGHPGVQPLPRDGTGSWLPSLKRLVGGEAPTADPVRRTTAWPAAFLSGLQTAPNGQVDGRNAPTVHERPTVQTHDAHSHGSFGSSPNAAERGGQAPIAPTDGAPAPADEATGQRTTSSTRVASLRALNEISARTGIPIADLSECNPDAVSLVPEQVARRYQIVPLKASDGYLEIATANPYDIDCENTLAFATSREIRMLLATPSAIADRLDELYRPESVIDQLLQGMGAGPGITQITESREDEAPELNVLAREATLAPVIKLVDHLLGEGIRSRASDIHIEPEQHGIAVRYRIDGVLRQVMTLPRRVGLPLISRIKIMSRLDIADRLRPQDGRARVGVGGKPVDLRVSTLPASLGEKVVIRILDTSKTVLSLDSIGFNPDEADAVRDLLSNRDGIILVTGPTGSGKTTTLYSAIKHVQTGGVNIITVEDPVEYRLKGIVQVQVHEKAGLTFASALRSILRQDPDVVLVGEIRDRETAQIAVQASLTGHLVLSTLHTNDAPSAVARLMDIGIEPYKIATAVRGVLAQRLMRRLCSNCKDVALEPVPRKLHNWVAPDATVYRAVGCPKCAMTGYRGRFGILEVLRVTPEVEHRIATGQPADQIAEAARDSGMHTLWESGLAHVLKGESTIDELLRVVDVPADNILPRAPKAPEEVPVAEGFVAEHAEEEVPQAMRFPMDDPGERRRESPRERRRESRREPSNGNIHIGPSGHDPGTMEVRLDSGHGVKSVQVPPDVKVMVVYVEAPHHSHSGAPQERAHHGGQHGQRTMNGYPNPHQHAYANPNPHQYGHGYSNQYAQPGMSPWGYPGIPQPPPIAAQYSHAVIYQPMPMPGHYPGVFQYSPYAWGPPPGMGPVYPPPPSYAPGGFAPPPQGPPWYHQAPPQGEWTYSTNVAGQPAPQAGGPSPSAYPPYPNQSQEYAVPVGARYGDGAAEAGAGWGQPPNGAAGPGAPQHASPWNGHGNGAPPHASGVARPTAQPRKGPKPNGTPPHANGGAAHGAPPGWIAQANGAATGHQAPRPQRASPNGIHNGANGSAGHVRERPAPPDNHPERRREGTNTKELLETQRRERRVAQRRKLSAWGMRIDRRTGHDRRAGLERRRADRRRLAEPVAFERRGGVERREGEQRSSRSRRSGFERRLSADRRHHNG